MCKPGMQNSYVDAVSFFISHRLTASSARFGDIHGAEGWLFADCLMSHSALLAYDGACPRQVTGGGWELDVNRALTWQGECSMY